MICHATNFTPDNTIHNFLSVHQTRNQWIYECLETGGVSMKANKIGWNSLSFVKGVLDWLYKRSNECDLHIQDLIVIKDCKNRLNYLNRVGHETILMKSVIMCCAVGDSVMAPALFAFCFVSCWGLGNLSHWHDHDLREYEAGMLQRWRLLNGSESNKLRQAETVPWWKTMQQCSKDAERARCFGRTNLATRHDTQDSPYIVRFRDVWRWESRFIPLALEPILAPTPENNRPAEVLLRSSMLHQYCSAWRWDIPPNGNSAFDRENDYQSIDFPYLSDKIMWYPASFGAFLLRNPLPLQFASKICSQSTTQGLNCLEEEVEEQTTCWILQDADEANPEECQKWDPKLSGTGSVAGMFKVIHTRT